MTDDAGHLEVTWRPDPAAAAGTRLAGLMRRAGVTTYADLQRWSVDDVARYWDAVAGPGGDLDLAWQRPYARTLDMSDGWEWATWWSGGAFNYVHAALDRWVSGPGAVATAGRTALSWEGEEGSTVELTYAELHAAVNRCANALRAMGVDRGDRVGLFLPMIPEVVIAQLAIGRIGAIYTPIFSGFGADAVAARLRDAEARLLVTCDGFRRRGSLVPAKETADEALAAAPSVGRVLVVDRAGRGAGTPWTAGRDAWWHERLGAASPEGRSVETDPETPYLVIYTSGTTGAPKGVLHVHGGFPIKAANDMAYAFDVRAGDRFCWLTDMGWMMGPWLVAGALMLGATVVIYDGTPDYPDPGRVWALVERHRVSVLGIAPTAIRALMRHGDDWVTRHDRSSLRIVGSSGEPWNPGPWHWFQETVAGGLPLINYSGGTEISGGIVSSTPITPSKPTSFAGPMPGMDADVVDDAGRSVRGAVGELVIRQPWPGMARGFWRDRERYLEAYWSRIPGVWVHGDWASVDEDGYWYIQGRSDDTLKVAGKRLGPAEVESAACGAAGVAEAAAIGVPDELKGEKVVVFCVPRPGHEAGEALREAVMAAVVRALGKAMRPDRVLFVRELPKTRSGKVMRRVIRAVHLGTEAGDLSSLENPAALNEVLAAR